MRNATQRSFNAADDHGDILKRFAATLGIHNDGTVRALAAFIVRSVAIDHGIHVPRRHPPEQIWRAQPLERIGTGPVGL